MVSATQGIPMAEAEIRDIYKNRNIFEAAVKEIADLYRYRRVAGAFVMSTLKMRYRRSFLGIFWSMLGPGLNFLVLGIVFSAVSKTNIPNFFSYMFYGAVFYNFISTVILQSPHSMIANEGYIKKIYLPKSIFVLNIVLMELINFCLAFVTLILIGVVLGFFSMTPSLLVLPYVILMGSFFSFGIASLMAILTVFFRDISHLLPVVMQAIFFGTPVVYVESDLPEKFQNLIYLNPMTHFIHCFRDPLYNQSWPPIQSLCAIGILALFSFVTGLLMFKQYDNSIVFRL